uniref:Secreted protein n=1 Tax=Bursaphelenchus xylophilus TaxID=6326 RepID=A0A1I7SHL3_BURXY
MLRSFLWLSFLLAAAARRSVIPDPDPTPVILRELNISDRHQIYIQSGEKAYPQVNLALKPLTHFLARFAEL